MTLGVLVGSLALYCFLHAAIEQQDIGCGGNLGKFGEMQRFKRRG